MKANELRIGNYLQPLHIEDNFTLKDHHVVEPTTLMILNGDISGNGFTFKPIALTEEWLLKLGFKLSCIASDKYNAPDDEQHYHIIKHNDKYIFRGLGASVVEVKTVHHLQNLYFALTGKELTL